MTLRFRLSVSELGVIGDISSFRSAEGLLGNEPQLAACNDRFSFGSFSNNQLLFALSYILIRFSIKHI